MSRPQRVQSSESVIDALGILVVLAPLSVISVSSVVPPLSWEWAMVSGAALVILAAASLARIVPECGAFIGHGLRLALPERR